MICISFGIAGEMQYYDKVISLYPNKNDNKASGRLLPTNPFEIVKTDGDKVLLKISGFVNPKAPSVLYLNDTQRIIVAAFAKNTPPKLLNVIQGKNGKWDKADIEVWATKAEFVKDNKMMLAKAKEIYMQNCGICHTAHKENEFSANQWPATFNSMVNRTAIDKEDRWLVIEYLQKNAKDYKGQ
ncbi:MAG: cytochrome C [Helicobacteraceae bacterium]|nr:cytochrome C [Helicobacteraceae bacterium]